MTMTSGPDAGHAAESWAKKKWDLDRCPDENWCDLINPRTGTRYQVKAATQRSSGRTRRVRLWEDQHRSLLGAHASSTAWYVFVDLTRGGRVRGWARLRPPTVTNQIHAHGGWDRSGHRGGTRQAKVPIQALL